jgi:hypothetical protein
LAKNKAGVVRIEEQVWGTDFSFQWLCPMHTVHTYTCSTPLTYGVACMKAAAARVRTIPPFSGPASV